MNYFEEMNTTLCCHHNLCQDCYKDIASRFSKTSTGATPSRPLQRRPSPRIIEGSIAPIDTSAPLAMKCTRPIGPSLLTTRTPTPAHACT